MASGAKTNCAQLRHVIDQLEAGDVLMVTRLDRLARSTRDLLNTLAAIAERKAGFRSLVDTWADPKIQILTIYSAAKSPIFRCRLKRFSEGPDRGARQAGTSALGRSIVARIRVMIGILAATFLLMMILLFISSKCWADPANPAEDNFEFVSGFSAKHIVTRLAKSVGLVELLVSESPSDPVDCTAVIIDTQTILTAAHCLEDDFGTRLKVDAIRFRMNYLSPNTGETYRVDTKPIELEDDPDYTLLKVVDPLPAGIVIAAGLLSVPSLQNNEEFIILHHPNASPMVATRRFCRIRESVVNWDEPYPEPFPGVLREVILEHIGLPHACDTMHGSSGAPIFMERTGLLVGIQRSGGLNDEDPKSFNGARLFSTIINKSNVLDGAMTMISPPPGDASAALEALKGDYTDYIEVYQTLGSLKQTRPFLTSDAIGTFTIDVTAKLFPLLEPDLGQRLQLSKQARDSIDHAVKQINLLLSPRTVGMGSPRPYVELRGVLPGQYDSYGTEWRLRSAEYLAKRVKSELCMAFGGQLWTPPDACQFPPGVQLEARGYARAHAAVPTVEGLRRIGLGGEPVSGKVEIRIFDLSEALPSKPVFDWVPLNGQW
jgi:hypothetical protein